MKTGIIILLLLILLAVWLISEQRKLSALDENVKNAMGQIGIQISSRYDAVVALVEMTRHYDRNMRKLVSCVREKRRTITAETEPEEAAEQDAVLTKAWKVLMETAERYPAVQNEQNYEKYRAAAESYERMLHTSGLIYNDTVSRYNQAISRFPANVAAGLLRFPKRAYLERKG